MIVESALFDLNPATTHALRPLKIQYVLLHAMTTVKGFRRPVCRPSPNEVAHLRHSQLEERRKARLLQVREQERILARQLRERVKHKRETERRVLKEHIESAFIQAHEKELRELEEKYMSRLSSVGQGHRDAQQVNEEENRLQELRVLLEAKQRWRAQDRHAAAMKELSVNQMKEKLSREQGFHCRQQALQAEKIRAKQVVSANPPDNQMIVMNFKVEKERRVQFKEAEGYSSTYYHIPNPVVQRLGTPECLQPTAHKMAKLQMEKDEEAKQSAAALQQEHNEKARLRYKHALARVKLEKERDEILAKLQSLEREDRESRRKSLARMPTNMFQPAHRRIEMASEQQREMEGAFERLFVRAQRGPPLAMQSFGHPSNMSSEQGMSFSITEQSSSSLQSQQGVNQARDITTTIKVTPDSGMQVDISSTTEESVQPQSTREIDSSSTVNEENDGAPHTSDSLHTSTTGSTDDSRPQLVSRTTQPPRQAWPASTATPKATLSSVNIEQTPTKAASTQTARPSQFLVRPSIVLERPELTVTDVASSDDQGVTANKEQGSVKMRLPTAQSKSSDGMKALLSMIQAQQLAWNDRLRKRKELIQQTDYEDSSKNEDVVQTSSPHKESGSEDSLVGEKLAQTFPEHSQTSDEERADHQPDLSIYTLSTRESTSSPTGHIKVRPDTTTSPNQQLSPDTMTSLDQLSIFQYHTTSATPSLPSQLPILTSKAPPPSHIPSTTSTAPPPSHIPSTTSTAPPPSHIPSTTSTAPTISYIPNTTSTAPPPSHLPSTTSTAPPPSHMPSTTSTAPPPLHLPTSEPTNSQGNSRTQPSLSVQHSQAQYINQNKFHASLSPKTLPLQQSSTVQQELTPSHTQTHDWTEPIQSFKHSSLPTAYPHTSVSISPLVTSYQKAPTLLNPPDEPHKSHDDPYGSHDHISNTQSLQTSVRDTAALSTTHNESEDKFDSYLSLPQPFQTHAYITRPPTSTVQSETTSKHHQHTLINDTSSPYRELAPVSMDARGISLSKYGYSQEQELSTLSKLPQTFPEHSQTSDGERTDHQPDLSIYTLSTRESTLSPTGHIKIRPDITTIPNQQLSPDTMTSLDQLSIFQYHTTFETSAIPSLPSQLPILTSTTPPPSHIPSTTSTAPPPSHIPNTTMTASTTSYIPSTTSTAPPPLHLPTSEPTNSQGNSRIQPSLSVQYPQAQYINQNHQHTLFNDISSPYRELAPVSMNTRGISPPKHGYPQEQELSIFSEDPGQLSILTLESSQPSITAHPSQGESVNTHVVDPEQLSILTIENSQPSVTAHPPQGESVNTHIYQAPPTNSRPASPVDELSIDILNTLDEGEISLQVNSDSFHGDRIQEEPLLSITDLDSTGYSHLQPVTEITPLTRPTSNSPLIDSPKSDSDTGIRNIPAGIEYSPSPVEGSATSESTSDTLPLPFHSGLSLQEAFLQRKKAFVKKSQQRLEQIKTTIEEQKTQTSALKQTQGNRRTQTGTASFKPSSDDTHGEKSNSRIGTEKKRRVVRFSSPLPESKKQLSAQLLSVPSIHTGHPSNWLFSKEREKIKKKEMKDRNARFYQRLPEVRKKMEEEKRKQAYSANREKAKSYQEKIRSTMRNWRPIKKTYPTSATSTKTKVPFK